MKKAVIKIILSLTAVIFAVSCGGKENSTYYPGDDTPSKSLSVYEEIDYTQPNYQDYNIIEADVNNEVSSEIDRAKFKFNISPSSANCTVAITKVTGGTTTLSSSDFNITTANGGAEVTISLSSSGLNSLSRETKGKEIEYTLTLKFTSESSEVTENKEAAVDIKVRVIPLKVITKTEVENMIKALKQVTLAYSSGIANIADYNFSNITFNTVGIDVTATKEYQAGTSPVQFPASEAVSSLKNKIEALQEYKNLGLGTSWNNGIKTSHTISYDKKTANAVLTFTPTKGYALNSECSFISTSGMKINLILQNNTWKQSLLN